MPSTTDVLVIGGGPGGYSAALRVAQRNVSVTIVEEAAIGGTCLNVGCIPSKVLIHAADVAAHGTSTRTPGVTVSTSVDMAALNEHVLATVDTLTGGVRHLLDAAGVRVVAGRARFTRANRVAVTSGDQVEHIEFRQCIVATGSKPMSLPGFEIDGATVIDSTGAVLLDHCPDTLAVIGGGYIGVELGTAFAKLGSAVTLVESAERILPAVAPELTRPVQRRLVELGVDVAVSHRAVARTPTGIEIMGPQGERREIDAEVIVVAIGRVPNTSDLGLEQASVSLSDSGHIMVGADRRAAPTVLAIGDVTDGPALAHKATAEADVAAAVACGEADVFDPAVIPEVIFSDPEIASVGHDVASAAAVGIEATSSRFPFTASGRARTLGAVSGHVELVADEQGSIIGARMVGAGVSELVGEVALAIEMAATVEELAAVIHPHPTMSESVAESALSLSGRPLHITS